MTCISQQVSGIHTLARRHDDTFLLPLQILFAELVMDVKALVAAASILFSLMASEAQEIGVLYGENRVDFIVGVDDMEWFRSSSLSVRSGGQVWSTSNSDQYLLLPVDERDEVGEDSIGKFEKRRVTWKAYKNKTSPSVLTLETSISMYDSIPVVVFDTVYIDGLTEAADPTNDKGTLSTFPSFVVEATKMVDRGWMTWSGNMARFMKFGQWSSDKAVYGDLDGGFPLVVFDAAMETAVVLSPFNSFMAASQTSFTDQTTNKTSITLGPLSSIDKVPKMYRFSTIMVAGGNVTSAMRRFGEVLRTVYRKESRYRETDFSINYLGYWTDNGACYYYYTGKDYSNYEDVLVAVKEDADKNKIPYRYVQLDSWWYYKGEGGGVKNWTARPDIFPNGIESLVAKTGWPVVAHNRYWSADTDYAKQFKFIVDQNGAIPVDPAFWDYLLSDPVNKWRLIVYEQDWLDTEVSRVQELRSDISLGMDWLDDMGMAAERYGITIQYCMPWPRHVLQSVMVPVVTQSRVSDDYYPDNSQWVVGDTTILAHAVGIAAFKDTFRSSSDQSDCASKYILNETYPMLETYVASLAGGPVGPGDMIGTADAQLLMATCMTDGRLLKTTYPAMSLDSTFLRRAFGDKGPNGQMTAAYTEVSKHTWYYVMAADLQEDYAMAISELPPSHNTFPRTYMKAVVFQYDVRTGKVSTLEDVTTGSVITVTKCTKADFKYMVVAPILPNGLALLGELTKFVTVSETRFVEVTTSGNRVFATLAGDPAETVSVTVYNSTVYSTIDCVIGSNGYATLAVETEGQCL